MDDVSQNASSELVADKIYFPHANQLKFLKDKHRYIIVVAGRRFGKSAACINYALAWIMNPKLKDQMVWIILPQYNQANSIYWIDPDIVHYYMPYVQSGELKKNDSALSLYCARTNSRLILKGADNADTLRGSGLDLIIWDEVADVKPIAFSTISPTLIDSPHHRVFYLGTPDGFNHFHDFALLGDHEGKIEKGGKDIVPDPDYMTYRFTSYDNLSWPEGSERRTEFVKNIEREKKHYYEQGQGDWFEQEYMAQFRKRAGAVHKTFLRDVHLIAPFTVPLDWKRIRGWDWGSNHPTASIRVAIDNDDNWFVEWCYKQRGEYMSVHAEHIKSEDSEFLTPENTDPIPGFGDPSGAQWIKELNNMGFSIVGAKRSGKTEKRTWTELAIDKINAKLAPREGHTVYLPNGIKIENAPSFFILNREPNIALVDEFETLSYKKNNDGGLRTELDDTADRAGHYDLHASLRYMAISDVTATTFMSVETDRAKLIAQKPVPDLRNPETLKALEHQADLDAIAQANRQNRY